MALCDVELEDDPSSNLSVFDGFLETVVLGELSSRLTRQSRKGSLPFSSNFLLNCMSVFCSLRWWWNASITSCHTAVKVSST